jgi:hypothetical protein
MAKAKVGTNASGGEETISGYFRKVFNSTARVR